DLPPGPAPGPPLLFPWLIRAWRLIRGTMMHPINRQALFHHDLPASRCTMRRSCILAHTGIAASRPSPVTPAPAKRLAAYISESLVRTGNARPPGPNPAASRSNLRRPGGGAAQVAEQRGRVVGAGRRL